MLSSLILLPFTTSKILLRTSNVHLSTSELFPKSQTMHYTRLVSCIIHPAEITISFETKSEKLKKKKKNTNINGKQLRYKFMYQCYNNSVTIIDVLEKTQKSADLKQILPKPWLQKFAQHYAIRVRISKYALHAITTFPLNFMHCTIYIQGLEEESNMQYPKFLQLGASSQAHSHGGGKLQIPQNLGFTFPLLSHPFTQVLKLGALSSKQSLVQK